MSDHEKIQQQAAEFVMRRDEPGWSSTDQLELDAWLNESMAHCAAFWRLEHGWERADRARSLYNPSAERPPRRPIMWRRAAFALAASIVLVVGIAAVLLWPRGPIYERQYATRMGQHGFVLLPDGSKIELNSDSRMRAELEPAKRQVWLELGEAYFDVKHDARRPFVVHTGLRDVSVLGTKFAIRRYTHKVVVSVLDGRVRVAAVGDAGRIPAAFITRGNIAIAEGSSTLILADADTRIENDLAWRDDMLIFDGVRLADAAAEFNRYNQQKLVISDNAAARILVGGTFQRRNVLGFVRLLSDAYGLRVEKTPTTITISQR